LETISFPTTVKEDGSRRRGMCCVCLGDKNRKNAVNFTSVHNVCTRTGLTDSSSNKQKLQGKITIERNFAHV
jgi:hypothetical protein